MIHFFKTHMPPYRLFGYIWIFSWIGAIWAYHLQFFLTGLFSLFLSLFIFERKRKIPQHHPPTSLTMDKASRTLVVQRLYQQGLKWEDHEVCSGDAKLPTGSITEGDRITDCRGNVALRHVPTNTLVGAYDFELDTDKNS